MRHAIYIDNPGSIDIAGPGPCLSVWDGDGGQGLLPGGQVMTYYKAVRPDGTSFHDPSFRWVPEDWTPADGPVTVTHPHPHDRDPSGWLSATTVPTDCTGAGWPCKLLALTPAPGHDVTAPMPELPNKRAASAWVVVDMLPATDALGPQGAEVAAIIEKARTLTGDEVRRLAAAGDAAWGAARDAAGGAAWDAAGGAAWAAAEDAARAAAWDVAWDAAGGAAWAAARDAAGDAAWDAAWAAAGDAAGDAAWDAARATLVRDLISAEQYATLMGPWLAIMGELS